MKIENIKIIVQARNNSSRFPNKIIQKVEDNNNFLKILLLRLLTLKKYAEVIIASTNNKCDDSIKKLADELNISVFRGDEDNVLNRFIKCGEKYNVSHIIRVCSDNPFVDLEYIKKLIQEFNGEDYLSYKVNKQASILSHCGFFTELVSLNALKIVRGLGKKICQEHVTNCIYQNTDIFKVKLIPIEIQLNGIRCTLDTKSDFEILKTIYFQWYKKTKSENQKFEHLTQFLKKNPKLLLKMKKLIKQNMK